MAASGIEPATFRFMAQRLNHCATAVPNKYISFMKTAEIVLEQANRALLAAAIKKGTL